MPWSIVKGGGTCSTSQWAVTKDSDGSTSGCHPTEAAARKQLAALYASEKSEASMSNTAERRVTPVPVEARGDSNVRKIGGYAAVFNRESQNLGGFIEVVTPGFFADSRSRGWPDVMARYNHDDNMLLGTTNGGTLALRIDAQGLDYEVVVPTARADVYELVSRGDIGKSSFAFRSLEDDWQMGDLGVPKRSLLSGQLVDVAPVNTPAYTDTTAGKRARFVLPEAEGALESLARHMDADLAEVRSLAEQNELRKMFVRTDGPPSKPVLTLVQARAMLNDWQSK